MENAFEICGTLKNKNGKPINYDKTFDNSEGGTAGFFSNLFMVTMCRHNANEIDTVEFKVHGYKLPKLTMDEIQDTDGLMKYIKKALQMKNERIIEGSLIEI